MKPIKKSEQGFTVIELVVVLAVFTIILLGLLALYDNYNKIYNVQEANARVIGASALTGVELQNDTRQASQIMTSHSFSGTTYTTDSDTLVLRLPSVDSSGNIIASQYDYIAYYLDGQNLYRRVLPYASSVRPTITERLSDTVTSAAFTYNNVDLTVADEIDINILMSVTVRQTSFTHRLEQTFYLHNL